MVVWGEGVMLMDEMEFESGEREKAVSNLPAFPVAGSVTESGVYLDAQSGMTLRDYFAAAALQGMLASGEHGESLARCAGSSTEEAFAKWAYDHADAMLQARRR